MKLEIELGYPSAPGRDAAFGIIEGLKYTSAGIRVAHAKGYINRDFVENITDALDREARRLEDLMGIQKGGTL